MKHVWLCTFGFMFLGMVGASPAKAANDPGKRDTLPSWDQQLQCDTPTTCPRFVVLTNWNNAAVLDRETGLVWERSPGDTDGDGDSEFNDFLSWFDAQIHCNNKNVGGRKGWRLPTLQDLTSLIDPSSPVGNGIPVLPSGHPFSNVWAGNYWSATTNAENITSFAWIVRFHDGTVHNGDKSFRHPVWCVRGGQGVDPQ